MDDFLLIAIDTNVAGKVTTQLAYWPCPPGLTCAQAEQAWHDDPVAISKEQPSVVIPTGKILQKQDCGSTPPISGGWGQRYDDGGLNLFFNGVPNLKIRSRITRSNGVVDIRPIENKGYTSPAFSGIMPYGSLHFKQNVPDDTYALAVLDETDTVLFHAENLVWTTSPLAPMGQITAGTGSVPVTPPAGGGGGGGGTGGGNDPIAQSRTMGTTETSENITDFAGQAGETQSAPN